MGRAVISFLSDQTLISVFLMAAIGYLVGSVKIRGLSLGTSGILLVALIFGHFGIEAPPMIQNIGLISFVTAVGLMAGPNFFRNFRGNAVSYLVLGVAITGAGALTCLILIRLTGLAPDLALGIMAGALTSTPGLAAAMEATGSSMASLGYGIAYPFGVISVVLFVQLMPKWLKADVKEESQKLSLRRIDARKTAQIRLITCDSRGFFGFALAIVLGLLIGQISIPLPGGVSFAMGTSGGPLFAGLILGYFGRIGKVDVSVNKEVLVTMREFGLAMFLIGVGSHAGVGLWRVLREQGLLLFLYGAVIAVVPMLVGSILARKVFRMNVLDMLGSICGGMTSTPALGTLIQVSGTDDVAASYAATYPVALAMVVLCAQLMGVYLK